MELKVWVEGIQRIVCGVTVNTTCQDVVFALAHATGKVGRFTLIERWRNNERLLAPNENPLKLLLKWGEYANDVQFILQRSESKQQQQHHHQQPQQQLQHTNRTQQETQQQQQQQHNTTNNNSSSNNNNNTNNNNNNNNNESTTVMLNKKSLGLSNINDNNNFNKQKNNSNNTSSSSNNTIDNALNTNTTIQQQQQQHQQQQQQNQKPLTMELSLNAAHERAKELKKTVHDTNIGIVKGIPQRNNNNNNTATATITTKSSKFLSTTTSTTTSTVATSSSLIPRHEKSHSNPIEMPSSASNTSNGFGHFDSGNNNISFKGNGAYQEDNNSNNNNNKNNHTINNIYQQLGAHNSKSINEINLAEVRNALDRRTMLTATTTTNSAQQQQNMSSGASGGSAEIIFTSTNQSNENLLDIFNGNITTQLNSTNSSNTNSSNSSKFLNSPNDLYKQATTISANGALVPPPYRDPPPPRNSPLQHSAIPSTVQLQNQNSNFSSPNSGSPQHSGNALYSNQPLPAQQHQQQQLDYDFADYQQIDDLVLPATMDESESIFQATQYNDLLQLIKFQREKINQQQMELSKYDAEIVYLESKERDQAQELEAISREITKADQLFRQGSEQLQTLQYVEEENELVKQQEKTLKSEIALLRSKLANCETELLQCKNKIRLLMDDIEIEQRAITSSKQNLRQNVERDFLMEMERIQSEIDQAIHNTDSSNKTAESLKKEILLIETAIAEKKRQVEQLVNEMKEVNLQSLTVTTSEEIKHLLEGSNKPGSSRRIIGSPRQLENAVPTSKNPHGVWV
ncbi:hypothetical protein DOY81_005450 [Sarcophaga bullata]|nr:hypothetical protein DOY81_005450 [Sarcophaga bullata]